MTEPGSVNDALMVGVLAFSFLMPLCVALKIQRRMTEPSIKRLLVMLAAGAMSMVAAIVVGVLLTVIAEAVFGKQVATALPWAGAAVLLVWFVLNLKRSDLIPDRRPTRSIPPAPTPPTVSRETPAAHEAIDVIFDYPLDRTNFGEIQFEYENLKGEQGIRRVRVQEFLYNGFKGYDLGKRGPRQFNYRGIQGGTVTLLDTGEILPVREWVADLADQK